MFNWLGLPWSISWCSPFEVFRYLYRGFTYYPYNYPYIISQKRPIYSYCKSCYLCNRQLEKRKHKITFH